MKVDLIRDRLIEQGLQLFKAPKEFVHFTDVKNADLLLNNLNEHPHAFVLACVMDRQIKAEKAWLIPYRFQEKLHDFSMAKLVSLSREDIKILMTEPEPLHRFPDIMSDYFYETVQRIDYQYQRDVSMIWKDKPSSADVVYSFLEFEGVGQKIANMAANILVRRFKVIFSDYFSIDISADVHIRRVFGRLGLAPSDAKTDQLIFRARGLYPKFPGLMDFPCWDIGRNWCKPKIPNCNNCYMLEICPSSNFT